MRLISRLVLTLLLLAGGAALWTMATLERAIAAAHERLWTLAPNAGLAYDNVERSRPAITRLPRIGDALLADVREYRSIADYWGADYGAVLSSAGSPDAEDPDRLFVDANAAYRASRLQRATAPMAVQQLDSAARRYAAILEKRPDHFDAAYNYEFVVRRRNRIARASSALPAAPVTAVRGGLPSGPTIHGDPGAPPVDAKLGQFDLIIPLQSDEDVHTDGKKQPQKKKG